MVFDFPDNDLNGQRYSAVVGLQNPVEEVKYVTGPAR